MSKSYSIASDPEQYQEHSEMEDFTDEEFISEDSEEDPSFTEELVKAESNLSKLSINKSNSRQGKEIEVDDEDLISLKLDKEDMKIYEQVQRIIDCGQVEKLKVDQCKVYLRKHGLRLTGKKDILIQRIKEHIEILNGGGEKKYPPSSFVFNCKGDACLGDIVMFEQTVYEGYSIVARSASGPPSGKRTIAGRIVNESYGAAKQQHTFTVEVLWSKGQNPLPPLHPLLIKGRNLYKLDTRRQKWEDEAERQRVLNEKHSRGTIARSNREARIQEKMTKKSLKGVRVNSKNKENLCHLKDSKRPTDQMSLDSEKLKSNVQLQVQSKVPIDWRESSNSAISRYPLSQLDKPGLPASRFHQESRLDYRPQISYSTHGYQRHFEYKGNPHLPVSRPPSYQQQRLILHNRKELRSYSYERENLMTSSWSDLPSSDTLQSSRNKHSTGPWERHSQRQQLCRYYPQGRCHYGNQCKFLHELSRN